MYVNKDDSKGSASLGDTAEKIFKQVANNKGYKVTDANKMQNMVEHWDFKLTNKDGLSFTFDVKGKKRLHRNAGFNDIIYIEIKNVNGAKGWVLGKADYITFLLSDGFYSVRRDELLKLYYSLLKDKTVYQSIKDKRPYTLYTRSQWGKKDQVMYIYKSDLKKIKPVKWYV